MSDADATARAPVTVQPVPQLALLAETARFDLDRVCGQRF